MKKRNSDNYIILGHPEEAEKLKLHLVDKYVVQDFDIRTVFADETPAAKILEETEYLPLFSQKKNHLREKYGKAFEIRLRNAERIL